MPVADLAKKYRIDNPKTFRLTAYDPSDTGGLDLDKDAAAQIVADNAKQLRDLQEKLFAQDQWAILIILQGMDAAGKDGVIEHVMSGINPQGFQIHSFKAPNDKELSHTFLWRAMRELPERGYIGIHNRSHYEECLVVRVHPEYLKKQKIPSRLVTRNIWKERYDDICAFERHLARNGTVVLKFHLRISRDEQRRRFLERIDEPGKRWKFNMGDVAERGLWDKYMAAYQDTIQHTTTPEAPWFVVPSDKKWFARLVVSTVLLETMKGLNLQFPAVEGDALAELKKVRTLLAAETSTKGGRSNGKPGKTNNASKAGVKA
ncbi:MAG: polyphosphate kinase 2 family protein [Pseudorhodoplanes sp.]|nr:polyphosphate kinase 2 family protein [Pseudorhodoplanes sp.]